ncbi:alkene reductase [Kribbella yunnanensis]|uniref:Alkene reductase n=1 Tax=Kribbella yunnanensis TaxID=190194 RepID=A0ABP4UMJ3_9ACTN
MKSSSLFSPYALGSFVLRNRIVLPPMTRNRADDRFVPTPRMAVYYKQRAEAGLMVSEGAAISPSGVAYPRVPGLWTDEQVEGWKPVTEAVHASGGVFFAQLWHVGRVSHSLTQPGGAQPVSASAVPVVDELIMTRDGRIPFETPRELTTDEVRRVVDDYAVAARNAIAAGFDGIELHGANGYLVDQFLNDNVNRRTDRYGGGVSERLRFLIEVIEALCAEVGAERVGVRLSPSGTWMQCADSDKLKLYGEVVRSLDKVGLSYLHLVEPTIAGSMTVEAAPDSIPSSHFRSIYSGTLIVSGDHTLESATQALADGRTDLVGFGRPFISNPDLPLRLATGAPLAESDRATYYTDGDEGYIDYPTLEELDVPKAQ